MAKFELKEWLSEVIKSFTHAKFPNLSKRGCNALLSKNQHGTILGKKTAITNVKSLLQEENKNRFKQCVCMWKELTDPQRILFEWREYYFPDDDFTSPRYVDMFQSLCLQWKLYMYLEHTIKMDVELSIESEDDFKVTFKVRAINKDKKGSMRRWMWVDGDWRYIDLDRLHIKHGSLILRFHKIEPEIQYDAYQIRTEWGESEEQFLTILKEDIARTAGAGKYQVYAEHEGITSNSVEINVNTAGGNYAEYHELIPYVKGQIAIGFLMKEGLENEAALVIKACGMVGDLRHYYLKVTTADEAYNALLEHTTNCEKDDWRDYMDKSTFYGAVTTSYDTAIFVYSYRDYIKITPLISSDIFHDYANCPRPYWSKFTHFYIYDKNGYWRVFPAHEITFTWDYIRNIAVRIPYS